MGIQRGGDELARHVLGRVEQRLPTGLGLDALDEYAELPLNALHALPRGAVPRELHVDGER
jgi:hypothetical protein